MEKCPEEGDEWANNYIRLINGVTFKVTKVNVVCYFVGVSTIIQKGSNIIIVFKNVGGQNEQKIIDECCYSSTVVSE